MFLYFVPTDSPKLTAAELARLGLSHAFDGLPGSRQITNGPGGRNGLLLWRKTAEAGLPSYDRSQTWSQAPGKEWWLGYAAMPAVSELARPEQLPGITITDEAGNSWLCPHARQFVEHEGSVWPYCALPHRLRLAADGTWQPTGVAHRYEALWNLAMEYETAVEQAFANAPEGVNSVSVSFERSDELAILALTANYYVSPAEVDLLGGYSGAVRRQIVETLRGIDLLNKLQKKTDLLGGTSSPGPEPPTPDGQ